MTEEEMREEFEREIVLSREAPSGQSCLERNGDGYLFEYFDTTWKAWKLACAWMEGRSKPQWKDAPSWAKFRARNKDGAWRWHEKKPEASDYGLWYLCNSEEQVAEIPNEDWRSTLEARPAEVKDEASE